MNPEAPTLEAPQPISDTVREMALQAVRDFPGCFWFRHPEAEIVERDDVTLVIRRLREQGGAVGWNRAQQLLRCL